MHPVLIVVVVYLALSTLVTVGLCRWFKFNADPSE